MNYFIDFNVLKISNIFKYMIFKSTSYLELIFHRYIDSKTAIRYNTQDLKKINICKIINNFDINYNK